MCVSDVELVVSRTIRAGRLHVFQAPVSPESCRWEIRNTRAGEYHAVLHKGARRSRGHRLDSIPTVSSFTDHRHARAAQRDGGRTDHDCRTTHPRHVRSRCCRVPDRAGRGTRERIARDATPCASSPMGGFACASYCRARSTHNTHDAISSFPGPNAVDVDLRPGTVEVVIEPQEGPIHKTQVLLVLGGMCYRCDRHIPNRRTRRRSPVRPSRGESDDDGPTSHPFASPQSPVPSRQCPVWQLADCAASSLVAASRTKARHPVCSRESTSACRCD